MKVLVINSSEQKGGAAVAAHRSVEALLRRGHEARMLVKEPREQPSGFVYSPYKGRLGQARGFFDFVAERLHFLPRERDKSVRFLFSLANYGKDISREPLVRQADILHLHWINQGFLSLRNIEQLAALGKPIVLTLHDMWWFTGGCHYSGTCKAYEASCGHCPFLKKPYAQDLSHKIWKTKELLFSKIEHLQVLAPSQWLVDLAKQSRLLGGRPAQACPNGIDTELFAPLDKERLREEMQLPKDKYLLFFLAMNLGDERKGFSVLLEALERFVQEQPELASKTELLLAGKAAPELLERLPLRVHYLGLLQGTVALQRAYSVADAFVIPSLEENFPNTVMESLSCGRPVLAFETGGIPEMVVEGQTGYLAKPNAEALAQGLAKLFADEQHLQNMGRAGRDYALAHFSYEVLARNLEEIYKCWL